MFITSLNTEQGVLEKRHALGLHQGNTRQGRGSCRYLTLTFWKGSTNTHRRLFTP